MRRHPTRLRTLAGWWLVWLALASIVSAPAHALRAVLCLGSDGHVAVERAAGPDCVDYLDHAAQAPLPDDGSRSAPGSHCGDCVDLELTATDSIAPAKPFAPAGLEPGDAAILPRALVLPASRHSALGIARASHAGALPSPTLAARRSVVLVI